MESKGDGGDGPFRQDETLGGEAATPVGQRGAQQSDGVHQSDEASSEFVQLLTSHQHRLRAYLIAMVQSGQQADDLLQETNMVLWKKKSVYDRNRPFFSWACGIAFIEVMRSRRRIATEKLRFDVALLESISDEFVHQSDLIDDRKKALRNCLDQLNVDDRRMIEIRYSRGASIDEVSSAVGKPSKTIYKALARIRESLYGCVNRTISHSQHPRPGS